MIIKPLLVLLLIFALLWLARSRGAAQTSALKKISVLLLFALAVFTIILPSSTNIAAHALGVGRGADLLLYILCLGFIGSLVNQYSRNKQDQIRLNNLARKVAIYEANTDNLNQQKITTLKGNE